MRGDMKGDRNNFDTQKGSTIFLLVIKRVHCILAKINDRKWIWADHIAGIPRNRWCMNRTKMDA